MPGPKCAPTEQAYVALLHGDRDEFALYALVLGNRLRRLDASRPRVLLVGRPLPHAPSHFLDAPLRAALSQVWTVKPVDLIDAPHATLAMRHRFVFTKLLGLTLPYDQIIFLDLDVLVRRELGALFSVPSPAGMYHGYGGDDLQHGGLIPARSLRTGGCINAGLLRLDPRALTGVVNEMLREIPAITEGTHLPEQFYIVQKLAGWRQIDPRWNYEVYPTAYVEDCEEDWSDWSYWDADWSYWDARRNPPVKRRRCRGRKRISARSAGGGRKGADSDATAASPSAAEPEASAPSEPSPSSSTTASPAPSEPSPRSAGACPSSPADRASTTWASRVRYSELPRSWYAVGTDAEELANNVGMFHFSGTQLQPWWYLHMDKPFEHLRHAHAATDVRGLIALSVTEWIEAVRELQADCPSEEVERLVTCMTARAREKWQSCWPCPRCLIPTADPAHVPTWEAEKDYDVNSCLQAANDGGTGGSPVTEICGRGEDGELVEAEKPLATWDHICEDCRLHSGWRAWRDSREGESQGHWSCEDGGTGCGGNAEFAQWLLPDGWKSTR